MKNAEKRKPVNPFNLGELAKVVLESTYDRPTFDAFYIGSTAALDGIAEDRSYSRFVIHTFAKPIDVSVVNIVPTPGAILTSPDLSLFIQPVNADFINVFTTYHMESISILSTRFKAQFPDAKWLNQGFTAKLQHSQNPHGVIPGNTEFIPLMTPRFTISRDDLDNSRTGILQATATFRTFLKLAPVFEEE